MTDGKITAQNIPLPTGWSDTVRAAVLNAISLAQLAAAHTRSWAADSSNTRIRLKAQRDRLEQEVNLFREEIRIKDARMEEIPAARRPHYPPIERMAILAQDHLWHVDLTVVPTGVGFWCSWLPFALPQRWPFCWWVAVALDHFSRREMGTTAFRQQPTSEAVRAFLGRAIRKAGTAPKHLVSDSGRQFLNDGFKAWCKRKGIQPRFGAIGQHGSIAVVERFILSLKNGCTRLLLTPYRREAFLRELAVFGEWYNGHRPHTWLGGKTPDEVYHSAYPANRKPRFEPRRWPRGSPCAKPWALIKGKAGARLELQVSFYKGRKHLPIVTLVPAAA